MNLKISKFIQGLKLLVINPPLFLKYFRKHLFEFFCQKHQLSRISQNKVKNIGKIIFDFNFDFPIGDDYFYQMYFNFYEIATIEFIKKTLKEGDIFLDIGTNIGYVAAVAADLVGKNGEVYAFEPIPLYFESLKRLALNNPKYHIIANQCALGEDNGQTKIDFAKPPNIGGSSMASGVLPSSIPRDTIEVPVMRLDDYIEQKKIKKDKIALIKIDVEGFEFPVLKGLRKYFENTKHRPEIICEITPSAYPLLGASRQELIIYMKQYGYEAYNIMAPWRKVDITKFKEGTNVVFKTSKQ